MGVDLSLQERVVIITGAAGSLGAGLVQGFAREGAQLFIVDRNGSDLEKVGEEARLVGVTCIWRAADVTSAAEVSESMREAVHFYNGRVDILVNAAGIASQGRIEEMNERDWDQVFAVNCRGTFLFIREVVPIMKGAAYGKIINFSSKSGKTGSPLLGAYSAAKAAVIGLTQSLAFELAEWGINVNCVCPGLVYNTGMCDSLFTDYADNLSLSMQEVAGHFAEKIPLKRLAMVEDVVDTVLFLASDRSGYMTGQSVNVSGGREVH
jgi:NAD(P)-dependent dehydrogenase (short-subunit alcohol dehydrogenase family)